MDVTANDLERFWSKVEKKDSGCWEWKAYRNKLGYGQFGFSRKVMFAHRFSCQFIGKQDISGKQVHHKCENPPCVNPQHLAALTRKQHIAETPQHNAYKAIKFNCCIKGHPFTEENTYHVRSGGRDCRTCQRERMAKLYRELPGRTQTYKGVTWDRFSQDWVSCYGKVVIGHFTDEQRASEAWNDYNQSKGGDKLRLNRITANHHQSGYVGVYWSKCSQRWVARITVDYQLLTIGTFDNSDEAAYMYDQFSIQLHGDKANLNILLPS